MRQKWLLGFPTVLVAIVGWSSVVHAVDLTDLSDSLWGPTMVVTQVLLGACYIVGAAFIMGSIVQYKNHRQSPKLVPLTTPIVLFILGAFLLVLPYLTTLADESPSAVEHSKREGEDIAPPSRLIGPSAQDEESGPGNLPPDEPTQPISPPPGTGHWTDNY